MKQDIHPTTHPVVFVDTASGEEFVTMSTLTSEETKQINGVDHYVIRIEISSSSHPFYTGQDRFVDTAGRVDKFKEKMEKAAAAASTRGIKKAKKAAALAAEQAEEEKKATAERKAKKAAAPKKEPIAETPVAEAPVETTDVPAEETAPKAEQTEADA
jgi:large subunit ribosomal protein L31